MTHLLEHTLASLTTWATAQGESKFRAKQIARWIYQSRVEEFEEMTNLSQEFRQTLADEFSLWTTEIVKHYCADDGTEKLLLRFSDGNEIECVLLRSGLRRTICISTQVGCAMGCVFCASGLDGVVRNLTTGEIIEQMLRLQRLLPSTERLSHIVVMGMGEPLANLDNLLPALEMASNPAGLGISSRRITISTVGLPRGINRLAETGEQFSLAISLHAADDTMRNELVPVNKSVGISALLDAADDYFAKTHRRLTFEYVLLGDLNDTPEQARKLVRILSDRAAMLNVIPYNRVPGLPYKRPEPRTLRSFLQILMDGGINVQVRELKGDAINAACGQLRRQSLREGNSPITSLT